MNNWNSNIISSGETIKFALSRLNEIGIANNVLFVVDNEKRLLGSVTDGDIRRGLLGEKSIYDRVDDIMNVNCKRLYEDNFDNQLVHELRGIGILTLPVLNNNNVICNILNLQDYKEILPIDAIMMAGGRGERLLPLTKDTPKPLVPVGSKPIIEYNIDRLIQFGIQNIQISVNYLADMIMNHFNDGSDRGIKISYIRETQPLGTIGSVSLVNSFTHDTLLLMNSDLLTNVDYSDMHSEFIKTKADMLVATVPHHVDLPYAILELEDKEVKSLEEKPRYTYFANAGIYMFKKSLVNYIPRGGYFNATDLMERVIKDKKRLIHYPILGYWLDIGRMSDYHKAQEDIKHIRW